MTQRLLLLLLLFSAGLIAQERVDLTVPIVPATRTTYTVSLLVLDYGRASILVDLAGSDGVHTQVTYTGATATTMLVALNKANLSTRSLNQRVLDRLVADGKISGTVAGAVP